MLKLYIWTKVPCSLQILLLVHPLQRLKWSLILKCAKKYVHAMKAFALLAPNFASSKIIPTLQAFHLLMLPSLALIL